MYQPAVTYLIKEKKMSDAKKWLLVLKLYKLFLSLLSKISPQLLVTKELVKEGTLQLKKYQAIWKQTT